MRRQRAPYRSGLNPEKEVLLPLDELERLLLHAKAAHPREACGLLVGTEEGDGDVLRFVETSSRRNTATTFRITDADARHVALSSAGPGERVRGCAHTHNLGRAYPSKADHLVPKRPGDLWLIVAIRRPEIGIFEWDGEAFHRRPLRVLRPAGAGANRRSG